MSDVSLTILPEAAADALAIERLHERTFGPGRYAKSAYRIREGVGEQPNQHDVLTGSDMQGRAFPGNLNLTCGNWTSDNFGKAMLGHADRRGIADTVFQRNPIASHMSRGCSQADLVATGGAGLFYCFAAQ